MVNKAQHRSWIAGLHKRTVDGALASATLLVLAVFAMLTRSVGIGTIWAQPGGRKASDRLPQAVHCCEYQLARWVSRASWVGKSFPYD